MSYGTYPQYPQGPYPPQFYPGPYGAAYALPPRRHSPIGVVSFVLAVMAGLGLVGLVVFATVMTVRNSMTAVDEESTEAMAMGLVFLLSVFGSFVGLGLGIGGLFQSDRKRLFAILGTGLNGLVLLGVATLLVLGIAAQQR
jgi:hypothetical protein